MKMSDSQSVNWAVPVRTLCLLYELPDPISLLQNEDAWSKTAWKNWCSTKVRSYHERLLRNKASSNTKMIYLNIQLAGLTERQPGDYLTYNRIALDN